MFARDVRLRKAALTGDSKEMRRHLIITMLVLLGCYSAVSSAPQQKSLQGNWVGGFWFNSHWVRVNLSFRVEQGNPSGVAGVTFSSYEGTNGANLAEIKFESGDLSFDVPVNSGKIAFSGQLRNETIKGTYKYGAASGAFGLTRVAEVEPRKLARLFGLYQLTPTKIIAIGQDIDGPNAVRYVDYETGQTSALWPSSPNAFFSGDRLRVTYPVSLRVETVSDKQGEVTKLVWKPVGKRERTASPIKLREEQVSFRNGDIKLGGTLITPSTRGPHPVIIITPGDFGTNRDFLRLFAYNFLRRGIAALIFDSRGVGESTGTANSNSFSELAEDVLAAVRLLKSKENINPKQIGLFGFSNSAWTTALAASRSEDVAFLINQSMSGVQPWRQETFRVGEMLRAEGFSEDVVVQGVQFMKLKFEAARTGAGWEQLQTIRERSGGERWFPFTNPPRSLERLQQSWKTSMTYDPVPSFEKITCPVLIVWGGRDRYVPAQESLAIFERAMKKARNKDYTVRILPTGSHSIFDAKTGSTTESSELRGWVPEYLNLLADWTLKRVAVKVQPWAAEVLRAEHEKDVEGVAFSPDGRLLASADNGGKIVLWNLSQRRPIRVFTGANFTEVAFSPDGRLLVGAGFDKRVRVWNVRSGRALHVMKHTAEVEALSYSPDGRLVASAGGDRVVRLWETSKWSQAFELAGHTDSIYGLAFSPEGRLLASSSRDRTIRLWDVATGRQLRVLSGHTDSVYSLAFSPDGRTLASGCRDGTIKLWDVSAGVEKLTLTGHQDSVHGVAFSSGGEWLASASFDSTVKVWEAFGGRLIQTLSGHSRDVNAVAFNRNASWLASVSDDKTVRLWKVGK